MAQPLACGGKDDKKTDDPQTTRCNEIASKIDSCNTCSFDTATLKTTCHGDPTGFDAAFHDAITGGSCDEVNALVCGVCPSGLVCNGGTDTTGSFGVCANSDGSAPSGAPTCTNSCTDQLLSCFGTSPSSGNCLMECDPFTHGTCGGSTTCKVISNFTGVCVDSTSGNQPSGARTCPSGNDSDCGAGQLCIGVGPQGSSTNYCFDACDAPACGTGTTCQDSQDSTEDTLCLAAGGTIPSNAQDCTSADCPVNSDCFNTGSGHQCIQSCFFDGSGSTASLKASAKLLLGH